MSLFTKEQSRDLREYMFSLNGEKRYKLIQVVRMLEDDGADQDTIDSAIYHLGKNEDDLDTIFRQMANTSLITEYSEEP